jgi:hypothetical protein
MNAAAIVNFLIEDISPEELLGSHPEWLYDLEICHDKIGLDDGVPVYFGEPDSHTYIGTIRKWPAGWRAYEVNPAYRTGSHRHRFIVNGATYFQEPHEAALELKAAWEKT